VHAAKVHHVENIPPEIAEIVVDGLREFLGRQSRIPRAVRAASRADLGDDDKVVGLGMQRFADQLIGNVRAVEIAGVDVVQAARHDPWAGRIRRARRAAWRHSPCDERCGRQA
jgi:hypothetical protein